MKNKFLRRAHLPEDKCNELLRLFADDLTATQIAGITGISRVTVNNYLRMLRMHIVKFFDDAKTSASALPVSISDDTAAVIFQDKNYFVIDLIKKNHPFPPQPNRIPLATVDLDSLQLKPVAGKEKEPVLEDFWRYSKSRLKKFRGLRKHMVYLHLKESEFRYNFRDADLFEMLMGFIRKSPLGNVEVERGDLQLAG